MQLDIILDRLVKGRERGIPSSSLAMQVNMGLGELEAFEQNLRRDFESRYRRHHNAEKVALELGWPIDLADRMMSVYKLNGKSDDAVEYRKIVERKTHEFFTRTTRKKKFPIEQIKGILHAYFSRMRSNGAAYLKEVETISHAPMERCRYVLQDLGLPLITRSRSKVTDAELSAMRESPFTRKDIVTLTGLGRRTLDSHAREVPFKSEKESALFVSRSQDKWGRLQYRDASLIYEIADRGLSLQDIPRAVGKSAQVVQYAIEHRAEIEPKIVRFLQQFYGVSGHAFPYKTDQLQKAYESNLLAKLSGGRQKKRRFSVNKKRVTNLMTREPKKKKAKKIEQYRAAIENRLREPGFLTTENAAQLLGVGKSHAGSILQAVTGKTYGQRMQEYLRQNSTRSIYELSSETGSLPFTLYVYLKRMGSAPNLDYHLLSGDEVEELTRKHPERRKLIQLACAGQSLRDIETALKDGESQALSHQAIRKAIIDYGLYPIWKQRSSTSQQPGDSESKTVYMLSKSYALQQPGGLRALEATERFFENSHGRHLRLDVVYNFFQSYFENMGKDNRPSRKKMAVQAGMSHSTYPSLLRSLPHNV